MFFCESRFSRRTGQFLSFKPAVRAAGNFLRQPELRELLLWCLPALLCGGLARALLLIHFPYGYIHPDSPDFLVTADKLINHHRVVIHGKKAFLGPILFLLPALVKLPTVIVTAWAQHLFGLIYTVMVGAVVRFWTTLWKWWIVPATVLSTLNPSTLYYEHALISEFQYLWCVTALALCGAAYATEQSRRRFILFLAALLLTAGSRPEGKLYVLFALILIPLLLWGQWRKLAVFGSVTLLFSTLTWLSTRNTQAGLLLYATLLPLAPSTPRKSAPDFGPWIAPIRNERVARGVLDMPSLVAEEKRISAVVASYFQAREKAGTQKNWDEMETGSFCERLAVEAGLRKPLLLPVIAFNKLILGMTSPANDGFGKAWIQDKQIVSCTGKTWTLKFMPRLTGLPIYSLDDLTAYVQKEFAPLQPDWFDALQRAWYSLTTGAGIRFRPDGSHTRYPPLPFPRRRRHGGERSSARADASPPDRMDCHTRLCRLHCHAHRRRKPPLSVSP